jgi:hypothetical protein
MIAGITHLTMESELTRGIAAGSRLGFNLDFVSEVELAGEFEGIECGAYTLPLAVLAHESGIRLEVVEHRTQGNKISAYSGVFRCAPSTIQGTPIERPAIQELLMKARILHDPCCLKICNGGEAWFDANPSGTGLAGIICRSGDVLADVEFWQKFARAKWDMVDGAFAVGSIPGIWSYMSCALVIVPSENGCLDYAMNDVGFPSLGVFSTNVMRDFEKAATVGANLRAPAIVTDVGNRRVSMALVETPGGNPVELLSTVSLTSFNGCG